LLEHFFSAIMPHIRKLELVDLGINIPCLPDLVARKMAHLVHIELSKTCFARIPTALSHITTLQSLSVKDNQYLQLEESDLRTIAALPHLKKLILVSSEGWNTKSNAIIKYLADSDRQFEFNF